MNIEEKVNQDNFIKSADFVALQKKHIYNIISLLLKKGETFQIRVPAEKVALNPLLPMEMLFAFDQNMLFAIEGYSLETFELEETYIAFQAGFGDENPIETRVSVELKDIHLVMKDYDKVLSFNLGAFIEDDDIEYESLKTDPEGVNKSMASFMLNPENSKFFK